MKTSHLRHLFSGALLLLFLASAVNSEAGLFNKNKKPKHPLSPPESAAPAGNPFLSGSQQESGNAQLVSFKRPFWKPPSYELPYSDYKFPRSEGKSRGFFSSGKPSQDMLQFIAIVRQRAEALARFNLTYKFGGNHPSEGGMDCSATMKYLLGDLGFSDMPRTSYNQYDWLKKNRTLFHSRSIPASMGGRKGIKPGDLIFWGGTYNSGHKVSHVMIYLGQGDSGTHYMFGARGKKKKGLNGAGVDVFKLNSGYQKSLVGFGSLPGVK
ncbi:MAG: NlpC/P60 family protein [Verrucomicrobiales bacterium]|nr:NlpC/P60 family protein [Verrucomicrobiales bacterium]